MEGEPLPDYVCVNRQILEHDDWVKCGKFDRAHAWIDLLLLARWRDGFVLKRGIEVPVKRGQVAWSIKGLATRWNWSRCKVRLFLECLKSRHQIQYQNTNVTTIITITNYNRYQGNGHQNRHQTDTKTTPERHQNDTKEECTRKENKKIRENRKPKKASFDALSVVFPPDLDIPKFRDAWKLWCQHRNEIKAKLTPTSVKQQMAQFTEWGPERAIRAIHHTILKQWRGIREPDPEPGKPDSSYKPIDWSF